MDLHVTLAGRGDRATRIYRELLEAILDGRLRAGERLPPTRELAARLAVSRNTVAAAYERLTAEGFLSARVGDGTYVQAMTRPSSREAPAGRGVPPRRIWQALLVPSAPVPAHVRVDFRVGVPDASLFPLETWRRLVADALRPGSLGEAYYGDPAGHPDLREAIARWIGISRSVRASAEDIVVTQGAQQALDLISRILIDPGGCVAVEEPGYPEARLLFQSHGARVVGVPVDEEGLVVQALPDAARLVYVTPSHQFPLGMPMSLARRTALLDWAYRRDAVIIEDDYDSEFRFSDRPLEPLQSLDRGGRVVYVGTFSKTLLPMLRMGFLVAPATLRPALRAAKRLTDWHGSVFTQVALARLIDDGLLARHIRKATREYAQRRDRLISGVTGTLGDWLELIGSAAGLHLCARLRPGVLVEPAAVVGQAAAAGVALTALRDYYADDTIHDGLVLGFGALVPDRIDEGLAVIAQCFGNAIMDR